MSREHITEARIWCDGCGLTYLEVLNSVEVDAMKQCGWISRERNGGRQDLCPTCRPDSPFEAVERVRELHRPSRSTIWSHDSQQAITVTTCQQCGSDPYPCPTIKALDGGSDE